MSMGTASGRIDEAGLAYARQFLNEVRPLRPWNRLVTADTIWHFAMGVGDDNPLYNDETYAASTSWEGLIAPPTYLYQCTSGGPPPGATDSVDTDDLLPGVLGLWGGDHWRWFKPTRAGMTLSATAELHRFDEMPDKGRGRRVHQVDRHTFYGDGELLAICDKTILRFEKADSLKSGRVEEYSPPLYTEGDRRAIAAQYDAESAQRRGGEARFGETVEVGDSLGRLVKGPLTITNMAGWLLGWGSFMCQTHRLQHQYVKAHPGAYIFDEEMGIDDVIEAPHFNSALARKTGMAAAYDFGGQRIAWLSHLITDWCGDDGFLTELTARLRQPNYLGDTAWIDGHVTGKTQTPQGWAIAVALTVTNQRGALIADCAATVMLPSTSSEGEA
jgi:acyl dehydratase